MSDVDGGRLVLVGLGIGPRGISIAGAEAARGVEHVFLEGYTAIAADPLQALSELLDRPVERVDRSVVEGQTRLLEAAADGGCCLLVVGDPLSATTHTTLQIDARSRGIEVEVHHGGSILTAAPGILGLSHYKFGRATTLVTPRGTYFPESPYEVIAANLERGLHTLVLLDIREDGSSMTGPQGAALLLRLEGKVGRGVLGEDTSACIVARAGYPDQAAWSGPLWALAELDCGEPMHTLVVPGELSEAEQVALAGLTKQVG